MSASSNQVPPRKQLRSNYPRRRRQRFSPLLINSTSFPETVDDSTSLLSFFDVSGVQESKEVEKSGIALLRKSSLSNVVDDSASLLSFFDVSGNGEVVVKSGIGLNSSNVDDDSASLLSFCDVSILTSKKKKRRVSGNGEVEISGAEDSELRKLNSSSIDDSLSFCDDPMKKKRVSGNIEAHVEVTEALKKENDVEFAEIEDSKLRKLNFSIVDDSSSLLKEKRVSGDGRLVVEASMSKLNEGTSNYAGSTTVSMDSVMLNCRGKQQEKDPKMCDENDECEVESAVKSGISSLSRVNEGTSNHAGSTMNSVMNKKNLEFCDENEVESAVNMKESENVSRSFPESIVREFDLECSEDFENSSQQSYSYSSAYSSINFESSEFENLSEEFTPSTWFNSGSQFSEKSSADGSPSLTFQLLNQFSEQFHRTCASRKLITNDYSNEINLLGLEDEEDEESYRMLKSREKRQLYLRDYAAEYCSTEYGHLIIEQRLEMVQWIFEHSTNMELQNETMFLGINLLDRFLSKGYFKSKRSLQIAGISCLTLATRIEENQPYNCVRQKTFYVGNTAYTRCEVVAMEWLVQEVLNFQCFLPTMYNFLWFYLKAARANDAIQRTVRYLATLALLSHDQTRYWPSTVAASLVIIACKAAGTDAHSHLLIESHSREKDYTLPECIQRLEFLMKYC